MVAVKVSSSVKCFITMMAVTMTGTLLRGSQAVTDLPFDFHGVNLKDKLLKGIHFFQGKNIDGLFVCDTGPFLLQAEHF